MFEKLTDDWILEHQNKYRYWQFEKLRLGLTVAAFLAGVGYVLLRRQSLLLTVLCLLIPLVCVTLDICFPAYFTLMHTKMGMEHNTRIIRISLGAPFFISLGFLALATVLNFHFISVGLLFLSGVVLSVVVAAILAFLLPECRNNVREMVPFLLLMAIVGYGITGQANYWLDTQESESVYAVVTELDDNYDYGSSRILRRGDFLEELLGAMYTCTVTTPDGVRAEFTMAYVGHISMGDSVILRRTHGALGLECYTLERII